MFPTPPFSVFYRKRNIEHINNILIKYVIKHPTNIGPRCGCSSKVGHYEHICF
jgi:hypothetical protein